MPRHFCLDIGGSFIKLGVAEAKTLEQLVERPTPADSLGNFVDDVIQMLMSCGMTAADRLGISITGTIDNSNGAIHAAHLPYLAQANLAVDLAEGLKSKLGTSLQHDIVIQNDADCFALSEARFGAGKNKDNVFAIIIGTGIGGAQVYRGQLIAGFNGAAGEWGHGPFVQRQDPSLPGYVPQLACTCGQSGCINTVGGARGLEAIHVSREQRMLDSRQIVEGWKSGDTSCGRSISTYLSIVSDALSIAINITGAEIVPVGGGMSGAGALLDALNSAVQKKVLLRRPDPLLVKGNLGENGGLWGIHARLMAEGLKD